MSNNTSFPNFPNTNTSNSIQILGPFATLPAVQNGKLALRCAYTTWAGTSSVTEVANNQAITVYDGSTFNATSDVCKYSASIMISGQDYTTVSLGNLFDAVQDLYDIANQSTVSLNGPTWSISADPYSFGNAVIVQWSIDFDSPTCPFAVSNGLPSTATEALLFVVDTTNFEYVALWDSNAEYQQGMRAMYNQGIFESVINNNIGNAPSDPFVWTTVISNIQKYVTIAGGSPMDQYFFHNAYNNDPDVTLRLNAQIVWNSADHAPALFFGQNDEWNLI